MKATGFIVMMVGVTIALFAGAALVSGPQETLQTGALSPDNSHGYLYAPLVFGLLVLGVGVAMLVFGGKGYFVKRSPELPTRPAMG